MLRKALADGAESDAASASEDMVKPALEQAMQRFEHYQLVMGEDGKAVELGRGAMGVTYKAFDVDLHCPVTLKVIGERYLGDALFLAVICGCNAGLFREALHEVYIPRIQRGDAQFCS